MQLIRCIKPKIDSKDWDLPTVTPVIQDFTLGSRLRRDDRMSPRALNSKGGNGGGGGGRLLPASQQSEAR